MDSGPSDVCERVRLIGLDRRKMRNHGRCWMIAYLLACFSRWRTIQAVLHDQSALHATWFPNLYGWLMFFIDDWCIGLWTVKPTSVPELATLGLRLVTF